MTTEGRHCGLCGEPGGSCQYERRGAYLYAHDDCMLRNGPRIAATLNVIADAIGNFIRSASRNPRKR